MNTISRFFLLIVVSMVLFGCGRLAQPSIDAIHFSPSFLSDGFILVNGSFEINSIQKTSRTIDIEMNQNYVFDDINDDNIIDLISVIKTKTGGSGVFYDLVIFENSGDELIQKATYFLGDRIILKDIDVKGNEIHLDAIRHSEKDPLCCPSDQVSLSFEFIPETNSLYCKAK